VIKTNNASTRTSTRTHKCRVTFCPSNDRNKLQQTLDFLISWALPRTPSKICLLFNGPDPALEGWPHHPIRLHGIPSRSRIRKVNGTVCWQTPSTSFHPHIYEMALGDDRVGSFCVPGRRSRCQARAHVVCAGFSRALTPYCSDIFKLPAHVDSHKLSIIYDHPK
jgi:hypothetical protein